MTTTWRPPIGVILIGDVNRVHACLDGNPEAQLAFERVIDDDVKRIQTAEEAAHQRGEQVRRLSAVTVGPIPMRIECPACGELHIDEGEFATRPHHTHACQHCGAVWRPAVVTTVGVRFLPGFKNETK